MASAYRISITDNAGDRAIEPLILLFNIDYHAIASRSIYLYYFPWYTNITSVRQTTMLNCQILYDLREVSGFVSGSDLHAIFSELVGNAAPSGRTVFDSSKARQVITDFDKLVTEKRYAVICGRATWLIHKQNLDIRGASQLAHKVFKHLQTNDKSWEVKIIPDEFAIILSGNSTVDVIFNDGCVQISRYATEETRPAVNCHVISHRIETTKNNHYVWNVLGLSQF